MAYVFIKQELLINEQIRANKVQVIDENGEKRGVMNLNEALDLAFEKKLDLVMVSPNPEMPVCKIMNYGKYKFEQAKREKEARKKQKVYEVKEIRITPNIEQHDFEFKAKNARKFLEDGNKVKITVRFRGRELNNTKMGEDVLNKFIWLNIREYLKIYTISAIIAFALTWTVNAINDYFIFINFRIFSYNLWLDVAFMVFIVLLFLGFTNVFFRKVKVTSWYDNLIAGRDLI